METNTERLKVGDIILIENFDMQHIGDIEKDIWAVYMGMDSFLDYPVLVYFCRATTQKRNFKKNCIEFPEGKYEKYGFKKPCLLDLNEKPYKVEKEKFNTYNITKIDKERLPKDIIIRIVDVCLKEYLSPAQLKNIKDSMSKVGINYK